MDLPEMRPVTGFEIVPVWKDIGPELRRELVDLWARTRSITDAFTAQSRSSQAVCIARDGSGAIVAVGTAMVRVLPRLQEPLYYYRQFFAPEVRGQGLAVSFYNRARAVLAAYNASLPAAESLGVLLEVENAQLAQRYDRAYVAEAESTFIGYSPRGLQLRVGYFEGAKLLGKPFVRKQRRVPGLGAREGREPRRN
jgi:hypothetical protein